MKDILPFELRMRWYLLPKLALLFLVVLFFFSCEKETAESEQVLTFDQLISAKPLEITLKTNLNPLFEKGKEEEYQPAYLELKNTAGNVFVGDIQIRTRGVTRKKICEIPPLKLRLGRKASKLELKLVIPCQEGEEYQQLLFKEHLVYKMYNQITDFSFRVQMVKLNFEDTEGGKNPIEKYGFVIEDNNDLAERMTADVLKSPHKLKYIDQEKYRMFTMFQYLIGNTDWNLSKGHNLKLVCKRGSKTPVPVPYDFDYCGLVNAPYAIPHPQLPIKNVRERHFMWRGKKKDGFGACVKLFEGKREVIFSLIKDCRYLDDESKKEMEEYVIEFYENLELGKMGILS